MQRSRQRQAKLGNRGIEPVPILCNAEILATHRAVRRCQRSTAGVLELLARLQQRLVTNDAETTHLLNGVVRIRDHPVTRDQLRGHRAGIFYRNRIREHVMRAIRLGLIIQILRLDRDGHFISSHRRVLFLTFCQARIAHEFSGRCKQRLRAGR